MKTWCNIVVLLFLAVMLSSCAQLGPGRQVVAPPLSAEDDFLADELEDDYESEEVEVSDPLEGWNRFWFGFNDKFYAYLMRPVSQGIDYVVPDDLQNCVESFFSNLYTPVRLVSNILQGDWYDAGNETQRFGLNSTLGIFGLVDIAEREFHITVSDEEDIGQTLGKWGIGDGVYIVWPFLGPSNARDSVGLLGNLALNPFTYTVDLQTGVLIRGGEMANSRFVRNDEYGQMKEIAFDPYVFVRDAYVQNRQYKIEK